MLSAFLSTCIKVERNTCEKVESFSHFLTRYKYNELELVNTVGKAGKNVEKNKTKNGEMEFDKYFLSGTESCSSS